MLAFAIGGQIVVSEQKQLDNWLNWPQMTWDDPQQVKIKTTNDLGMTEVDLRQSRLLLHQEGGQIVVSEQKQGTATGQLIG